jgi:hypothetical protein
MHVLETAANTTNITQFLEIAFPPEWKGIAARILETGVTMSDAPCKWAPRWSQIPPTKRYGDGTLQTHAKSIIFRVHDCLHQLWGLPHPGDFSEEDFYYYKRGQMCGEVAVLTITEFVYAKWLYDTVPELREMIWHRNALPLLEGPLKGKSLEQLAMRLDGLLHKKIRPRWVRENPWATNFCDDYVPMLEKDRAQIDINWEAMKRMNWKPDGIPKARFGRNLDGLELTVWMIHDFEHLLSSHPEPDWALVRFNRERRRNIILPAGWVS